jgi:carboxyl-terminal processing protease
MKKVLKKLWGSKPKILIISCVSVVVMFTTFSFVSDDFKLLKSLDIYYTLFRELNLYYVDETNPEKLVQTSIDAMLESLDPYTVFIPESEMEDYKFLTTGQYGGIGALVKKDDNYIVISEPYEGKPAYKAGIKAGDIVHEINGKSIYQKSMNEVGEMLKGDPNSPIELTLERPGQAKRFKKTLLREKITVNNVPYFGMASNHTGYIKLSNFTEDAHLEVKNALVTLKANGAQSIIIDLRSNPGGLLGEAIDIANLFVDKGQEIVHTRGKWKQWETTYKCQNQPIDTKIPIAILVNRNSASASEIVAGSLQDLDRAVIVGQRTFGKGLVQATRPLSYNTQLKVTTAKYYIPSGRCIQALDYTHREADGSVGHIPDSLIHEFQTKNKRKVFDGGGILPDVSLKPESLSRITYNLYARNFIFNYATTFANTHDSIPSPEKFSFSDENYASFVQYIKQNNFDYKTESEEALAKLKSVALKEKYIDSTSTELEALSQKITHDKLKDLKTYSEEIRELLEEEIVSRYYYQQGRIQISLQHDPEIKKAIEVLNDKKQYSDILSGTVHSDMSYVPVSAVKERGRVAMVNGK